MTTVTRVLSLGFSAFLLVTSLRAQAFFPDDFDRYLVPVYIQHKLDGAFGSRFVTEFSLLNTSDEPVLILGYDQGCRLSSCPPPLRTPPGITLRPALNFWAEPEILGIYLFVEKGKTAAFSLRVRDLSRDEENFGTEVPVIPESRARAGIINILGIPTDPRFRQTVRVYDFHPSEGTSARIRIYKESGDSSPRSTTPDVLLAEIITPFFIADSGLGSIGHPGLAELIGFGTLPELEGVSRVRLEIEATSLSSRLWSMVSVTNNTTQLVTLVTSEIPNQ